jgi:hypothetical protein
LAEQRDKADDEPFVRLYETAVRPWVAGARRLVDFVDRELN